MAKTNEKSEKDGATKEKKAPVARKSATQKIAERGKKGIISVMTEEAFDLATENKFEGTGIEKRDAVTKELTEIASQNGTKYRLANEKGVISKLDEKSDAFNKLLTIARSAKADLEAGKYSKNVQSFVKHLLTLQAPSESKISVLKSVEL